METKTSVQEVRAAASVTTTDCPLCGRTVAFPPNQFATICPNKECTGFMLLAPAPQGQRYLRHQCNGRMIYQLARREHTYIECPFLYQKHQIHEVIIELRCGQPVYGVALNEATDSALKQRIGQLEEAARQDQWDMENLRRENQQLKWRQHESPNRSEDEEFFTRNFATEALTTNVSKMAELIEKLQSEKKRQNFWTSPAFGIISLGTLLGLYLLRS